MEGNNDDLATLTLICEQDLPLAFPQPTTTWNYIATNGTTLPFRHVLPSNNLTIPVEFNDTILTFGPVRLEYFDINGNSVTCEKKNGAVTTLRTIFRICGKYNLLKYCMCSGHVWTEAGIAHCMCDCLHTN